MQSRRCGNDTRKPAGGQHGPGGVCSIRDVCPGRRRACDHYKIITCHRKNTPGCPHSSPCSTSPATSPCCSGACTWSRPACSAPSARPWRRPGACTGHPPAGLRRRPGHHRRAAEQHRHRPDDHRLRRWRRGRPGAGPGRYAGRQRRHHPDRPAAVLRPDLAGAHPDPGRRLDVPPLPARPHPRPGPRLHRPGPVAAVAAPAGAAVQLVQSAPMLGMVLEALSTQPVVAVLLSAIFTWAAHSSVAVVAGHVAGQPSHGAARGLRAGAGRQPGHRHQSHDRGRHRR